MLNDLDFKACLKDPKESLFCNRKKQTLMYVTKCTYVKSCLKVLYVELNIEDKTKDLYFVFMPNYQ